MKWIHSSIELVEPIEAKSILLKIESALRTCYKSEDKIQEGSAEKIIKSCIMKGHESPLEHASITFRVICDRGVSHEWVRHRIASYSQESTRYCNYTKDKFGNELTFVLPSWMEEKEIKDEQSELFLRIKCACEDAEWNYNILIKNGATPDIARSVLPNCIKTEFVCTMNIRELRNFFRLRLSKYAHADIRKLAAELLEILQNAGLSILFEDLINIGEK